MDVEETELQDLYSWVSNRKTSRCEGSFQTHEWKKLLQVDEIPLSRPKRNIARDFSDAGVLDARKLNSELCCGRLEDQPASMLCSPLG